MYIIWNWSPVQVWCMRQGALGWFTGITMMDGMGREEEAGFRMGNTCTPMADSCECMAKLPQYCKVIQFSSVAQSCPTLQPHELQHAKPPRPSATPRDYSNSYPLSRWCHPAISSSIIPFSSCSQSSQHQGLFQWVSSSHEVAKILEFQHQHQSFQWTPRTDFL